MDIIQVVLYGMGGVGKTQIALEYIYRYSRDYSAVFWINAATEQTTKLSFTHIMQQLIKHYAKLSNEPDYSYIGRLLGMAGKLDSAGTFTIQQPSEEQHVVDAVKEWFTTKENTKWLLVFDNLDDLTSFNINDYIPSSAHGTVIITSRRRESVHGRRWLEVEPMEKVEAEELLVKSAKLDLEKLTDPDEAAATIVQKLGYLPLAIDQAGAYIYTLEYSFSRYLREYQAKVNYLLSKEWKGGQPDKSVFAAWDLSFNAIEKHNPNAAELLLLCGFLDNNDIYEELLRRGMESSMDDTTLGDSIRILFSYSMAKRKDRDDSFSIHPVVHKWAQWKLQMEPERHTQKAVEAFLMVACTISIPTIRERELEDWVFERRILPHIFSVEKQVSVKTLAMENKKVLEAVDRLCTVYMEYGYYKKAEEMSNVVLAGEEKFLGADHPDTLVTVNNMGMVLQNQGQYNDALKWYDRALAGREKVLGADHPDTLTTVFSIATLLENMGQSDKALELYQRALAGEEKTLGRDHPHTLTTIHSMASVLQDMGQHDKALELYQQALVGKEKVLGADHPETLATIHNIAFLFEDMGQLDKALELYQQALAGEEKVLGTDHPETLATIHNIASLFQDMGQPDKALELYQQTSAAQEKILGAEHPDTLITIHNIASLIGEMGQPEKALELFQRALAGREKSLGIDHLTTLTTVLSMAGLFYEIGQPEKALEFCQRGLDGQEKALGKDHPDTFATVRNMACLFQRQGQYDKALELLEQTLARGERSLGIDHADTLTTVYSMAVVFERMGQSDKALEYFQRALVGRKKALGAEHPDTLEVIDSIANLAKTKRKSNKARKWFKRAVKGALPRAN
ncbi:hypothetical protein BDZ91DRAFT_670464 [Kalaharituber pfeilii]|nr:hypothetical protein BDZ91DRAFT_670464 [Kalaharituber pfeilii]